MMTFNESYKTAVISTANITEADSVQLKQMSQEEFALVAERETGFFVKLLSEVIGANEHPNLSPELNTLLVEAAKQGFGCVEIDMDAEVVDGAPVFEW